MVWKLFGGLAAGATYLAGRSVVRRAQQDAAARASELAPHPDLTHLPVSLQHTALWAITEGGFERRVVHGTLPRPLGDVALTAFDLEPHRERRGEWAYLPVEPPFRVGGLVSIVVAVIDRQLPHVLLKRDGRGDELADDSHVERVGHLAKNVRDVLRIGRRYESELPKTLPRTPHPAPLPAHWRAYTQAPDVLDALLGAGLRETLTAANRRDLVVELLGDIVVIYPAARDVVGADAFADLTTTALEVVDGILAASAPLTPRGIEPRRS